MGPAAYLVLFLLGGLILYNNQKKSVTEQPKVEGTEEAKSIEHTSTIPEQTLKNETDLCATFEMVEPSLGKYQLIVDAPNGIYTPNTRYKGE